MPCQAGPWRGGGPGSDASALTAGSVHTRACSGAARRPAQCRRPRARRRQLTVARRPHHRARCHHDLRHQCRRQERGHHAHAGELARQRPVLQETRTPSGNATANSTHRHSPLLGPENAKRRRQPIHDFVNRCRARSGSRSRLRCRAACRERLCGRTARRDSSQQNDSGCLLGSDDRRYWRRRA